MSSELLQTIQHLSQAAKIVDGDNRTKKLLHSYYLSRIQKLAAADNISVESTNSACTKCTTSFNDSKNFNLSIKPRRIRKEKYKKLVNNLECKSHDKSSRLKFKRSFGRKYQKLVYNVAKITCKLCNSNTKSSIRFETKDKIKPKSTDPPTLQLSELELVKPKKRKRDMHAGLLLKDSKTSSPITHPPKSIIQPIKVMPTKSNTKKFKKAKGSTADTKTKSVSSAQKQRKGILLLANILKMNDQRQQDSSQTKLNKMFK